MSKRKAEDHLLRKYQIKKLEKQQANRRRRIIVYSNSESDLENEEIEERINHEPPMGSNLVDDDLVGTANTSAPDDTTLDILRTENHFSIDAAPEGLAETVSELDPEIRLALGDPVEEIPAYGENIHADIAKRWLPILRKGLTKDVKEKLLQEYSVPDNCRLLKVPSLNPEIAAAVAEIVRARDKKLEAKQGQLGLGITAISKAMSVLLGDGNKVEVIKLLSEGCRILSDLHFIETQTRSKLITPCLDKSFLNIIQDDNRDDTLFGTKLSEKIRSAKVIEKQGLQIKRNAPVVTKSTFSQQTATRRQPGNWTGPPRYATSANRGGRGGYTASRYSPNTSYSYRRNQTQAPTPAPPPPAARTPALPNKHPGSRPRATRQ